MFDLRQVFSFSVLTLAGVPLLSGCVDPLGPGADGAAGDGISIEEGETGEPVPDLPEEEEEGTGEEEEPPTCESTTAVAQNIPPNVMLVLDKSRSMVLNSWDDDGDPQTDPVTRWFSLHGTVDTISTQYDQGMNLGLTLFPAAAATAAVEDACMVSPSPDVETGLGNGSAIMSALPAAEKLDLYGATPATAGVATALGHLESLDDDLPAAMILVTDGAANCSAGAEGNEAFTLYDEDLAFVVADAWDRVGIPTYVIGIDIQDVSENPFTNPREKLDEVAQLGGVPRAGEVGFYDAANAGELMAALDEVAATVSCTVKLGKAPSGPDQLVITIDGTTIEQVASCDEGDGWIFTDPQGDLSTIELCNAACDAMLDAGEVEAEFLCPPQP